jgi:hypothetical protein
MAKQIFQPIYVASKKLTAAQKRKLKNDVDNVMVQLQEVKVSGVDGVKVITPDLKKISTKLDSMSEMGEMESLRLQMAMDRVSKMMSTLSNILKKMSDTQQSIIDNLK